MKIKKGFTLIELLIVIVILAALAALLITRYRKTIENNRAINAVKILRMLGSARRMQMLDNGVQIGSAWIRNEWFDGNTPCPENIGDIDTVQELHACGYGDFASVDWRQVTTKYLFYSCGGKGVGQWCCNSSNAPDNVVACTVRYTPAAPDYSKEWKYFYTEDGRCVAAKEGSTGEIPPCIQ